MRYNYFKKLFFYVFLGIQASAFHCTKNDLFNLLNSNQSFNTNSQYRVFVTSQATKGDMSFLDINSQSTHPNCSAFSGIGRANCVCDEIAAANNLKNATTYRAWLSSSSGGGTLVDALCNIVGIAALKTSGCSTPSPDFEYVDLYGNLLFKNWQEISNGLTPRVGITTTENGDSFVRNVWTGTSNGGAVVTGSECSGWGVTGIGTVGNTGVTGNWTNDSIAGAQNCSTTAFPIYCFEGP